MKNDNYHESVMIREVIESLHIKKARKYIDATLGTGGHTIEITNLGGEVLGIEADEKMLSIAKSRLEGSRSLPPKLVQGNFVDIDQISKENDFSEVSGILFDLGVSNLHLTSDDRGFSFSDLKGPLDMRLNSKTQGVSAKDLLNALREDQLIDLFSVTMEISSARWTAARVIEKRENFPFKVVSDFLEICDDLKSKPGLNAATLPFLALRIAVNSELYNLSTALPKAYELLGSGGYLVVLTFHSGEDKIVKKFFEGHGGGDLIFPSEKEISENQRSRSAKLRVLKK